MSNRTRSVAEGSLSGPLARDGMAQERVRSSTEAMTASRTSRACPAVGSLAPRLSASRRSVTSCATSSASPLVSPRHMHAAATNQASTSPAPSEARDQPATRRPRPAGGDRGRGAPRRSQAQPARASMRCVRSQSSRPSMARARLLWSQVMGCPIRSAHACFLRCRGADRRIHIRRRIVARRAGSTGTRCPVVRAGR